MFKKAPKFFSKHKIALISFSIMIVLLLIEGIVLDFKGSDAQAPAASPVSGKSSDKKISAVSPVGGVAMFDYYRINGGHYSLGEPSSSIQ
ncbi:MAG: hypothetical protein Q8930_00705 [Bacillota bacterium]|nr:hypothetical protein [Bacillota bacterium]